MKPVGRSAYVSFGAPDAAVHTQRRCPPDKNTPKWPMLGQNLQKWVHNVKATSPQLHRGHSHIEWVDIARVGSQKKTLRLRGDDMSNGY